MTQRKSRNEKDWVTTVLKDIEELEIGLSFEEPYQPLPQRKVDRRGRRGCIVGQLTRHKPGIFTTQDIRIFLKPKKGRF